MTSIANLAQPLQMRIGLRFTLASIFASRGPVCCSDSLQNEQRKLIDMETSIAFRHSHVSTIGPLTLISANPEGPIYGKGRA